jgi:hypothetical protein
VTKKFRVDGINYQKKTGSTAVSCVSTCPAPVACARLVASLPLFGASDPRPPNSHLLAGGELY